MSSLRASGELCDIWGQPAAGGRDHQRPGSLCHPIAGGEFLKHASSSFMLYTQRISLPHPPVSPVQQIPDILRVGAKRYFGQTALGGPFHVILWVGTFLSSKIKHTVLKYLLTFLVFFDQYQLRLLGGAAVCVQSLWGAGRGRGDGTVFSPGLEQRHVLRSRLSNARPLCHHDTEGRTQLSLDSDTVL